MSATLHAAAESSTPDFSSDLRQQSDETDSILRTLFDVPALGML